MSENILSHPTSPEPVLPPPARSPANTSGVFRFSDDLCFWLNMAYNGDVLMPYITQTTRVSIFNSGLILCPSSPPPIPNFRLGLHLVLGCLRISVIMNLLLSVVPIHKLVTLTKEIVQPVPTKSASFLHENETNTKEEPKQDATTATRPQPSVSTPARILNPKAQPNSSNDINVKENIQDRANFLPEPNPSPPGQRGANRPLPNGASSQVPDLSATNLIYTSLSDALRPGVPWQGRLVASS